MTPQQQQQYWKKQDRKKRAYERVYVRKFKKALNQQLKPLIKAVDGVFSVDYVISSINQLITPDAIESVFKELYRVVGTDFVKDSIRGLKSFDPEIRTKREGDPNLDDPEAMQSIWVTAINSYVTTQAASRITSITETSRKEAIRIIREITQQAFDEGLGIPETKRLLNKQIPIEWRKLSWRAELIARTEILTASNEGAYIGAKATGLALNKVWIARLDGRERESHRAVNGQIKPIDDPFDVGGVSMQKPGQSGAPADEVCNCRCTIAFLRP